jgi:serine/threonine protein phosphatase PrpC
MAQLDWGSATHPGQLRPQNEDNLLAIDGVYVVADGMGGHEAGEVASQIAVERVRADLDTKQLPEASAVVESISNANGDIFRAAIANPGQAGMGTTITAIAVIGDKLAGRGAPNLDVNDDPGEVTPVVPAEPSEALVLANVGDSRTYLLRHNRLRRVTVDHSYVQELVATGHISEDEARTHPRRNIITRALGIEPDVKVDWWTLPLIRGDRFLLCSDGLVDEVDDDDIKHTLTTLTDPQEAADRLVDQANEAGGRDNITVIILDVLEGDEPPDPTQEFDVVPVWTDVVDPTPAGSLQVDADGQPFAPPEPGTATKLKRSDRGPKRFLVMLAVAAVFVASFAAFAAWARRGYYLEFNDDDVVTIYKGRTDGVLWFDPTEENTGPSRDILDDESVKLVEARPRFDTRTEAAEFIREDLSTIPTTTVPASTTTTTEVIVAPTSTVATATTAPTTTTPAITTTVP